MQRERESSLPSDRTWSLSALPWLVLEAGETMVCRCGVCAVCMHRIHHTKCRRRLAAEWPAGGGVCVRQGALARNKLSLLPNPRNLLRDVTLRMPSLFYLFSISHSAALKSTQTDMGGPNRAYDPLQRLQPPTDTVFSGRCSRIRARKQLKSSNSDSISSHLFM